LLFILNQAVPEIKDSVTTSSTRHFNFLPGKSSNRKANLSCFHGGKIEENSTSKYTGPHEGILIYVKNTG